ncbi:hypothetical protein ABPG75_001372 [Micractinium tetrahymenae]
MGGLAAPPGGGGGGAAGYATAAAAAAEPGRHPRLLHDPVYIVSAVRSPLGAFMGGLSPLSATDLGAAVIKAALARGGVPAAVVGEVYMGNVCSANLGQAPARQASLKAGLPLAVDCTTVNKVCSSGLKAVMLGAQSIMLGANQVVVAGGMESMSNIPFYAPGMRGGARLGHSQLVDGMLQDGLWDAFHNIHMGECAEMCAEQLGISREEQDAHAIASVERAREATRAGLLDWELAPVEVPAKGGGVAVMKEDEAIAKMNADKLRKLKPFFRPQGGTITAGNASPISDGAAAVVLASAHAVRQYSLPVVGRILGFGDAATDPRDFPTAPTLAIPRALGAAGLTSEAVDYWEVNEAFSVVDLANRRLLGLDPARVNVFGGAVAIGHPIGASGTRLIVTLLNVLRCKGGRLGVAAICNAADKGRAIHELLLRLGLSGEAQLCQTDAQERFGLTFAQLASLPYETRPNPHGVGSNPPPMRLYDTEHLAERVLELHGGLEAAVQAVLAAREGAAATERRREELKKEMAERSAARAAACVARSPAEKLCKQLQVDPHSQLTKTRAQQVIGLDSGQLLGLHYDTKPNPRNPRWAPMRLYKAADVAQRALQRGTCWLDPTPAPELGLASPGSMPLPATPQ